MSRHQRSTPNRNVRLADQIQQDLAHLIQREIDFSHVGLVTLTRVELSADYAHAKVYFSVLGAEPELVLSRLNDKAGWLHALLYKQLHIHTVPTLHFIHDTQLVQALEISQLIDQAIRATPVSSTDRAEHER